MDKVTWVEILDEIICILHEAYTPGKGMNPTILPPAMCTIVG